MCVKFLLANLAFYCGDYKILLASYRNLLIAVKIKSFGIPMISTCRAWNSKMPGYNVKFVDKVRKRHQCPLCHLPIKDPVQITTCKHRFCDTCLQEFLGYVFGVLRCFLNHLIELRAILYVTYRGGEQNYLTDLLGYDVSSAYVLRCILRFYKLFEGLIMSQNASIHDFPRQRVKH